MLYLPWRSTILEAFCEFDSGDRKRIQFTVLLLRCDYVDDMAPALERQAAIQRRFAAELQKYFARLSARRRPSLTGTPR